MIALPSGGRSGGDLYALFSCGRERYARIVLADAVGHGFTANDVAMHVHGLLHKYSDVRDTAGLLAALNQSFEVRGTHGQPAAAGQPGQASELPWRLATVVTANYDRETGEFNYAYAAHPRMLLWVAQEGRWVELGEGLEGLPLGVIAGETYNQQSVRLAPEDMVMAFSDALTEVKSPQGAQLTNEGFLRLAGLVTSGLARPISLADLCERLLGAVRDYHGSDRFEDDLTLLTLRRLS